MKVSRTGYARCPGCLSHVKVSQDRICPFCGEEMAETDVIGTGAMEKLRSSRATLIAMGLAGGVTFAVACGDSPPKNPDPEPNNVTADYGGFDPDYGTVNQDMGTDVATDPNNVTADYGGFDPNIVPGPDAGPNDAGSSDMG